MTDTELRALLAAGTARPWFFAYNRIVSEPVLRTYDALEREFPADITDDDPRWDTLPEPNVTLVSTSHGDTASRQGAADAALIVGAVNAVEDLLDENARLKATVRAMRAAIARLDDRGRTRVVEACRDAPGACFCGVHLSDHMEGTG